MNQEVTKYISKLDKWNNEITLLRKLILDCGLVENYKWTRPCYTFLDKNILLIHEFKNYCAILFFKGSLLNDSKNILIQQTENTQSARQIRFTSTIEINQLKSVIKEYIHEAIQVEKLGIQIVKKKTTEFEIPEELKQLFNENPELKKAFKNLTPGRQRGYLLHFTKPKQAKTRISRIRKNTDRILNGYGLNDCNCGLTKRRPNCDGSHKQLVKN
jgi:uncharacterized protein YdeI (YjbR/CyaY-like superfamily)